MESTERKEDRKDIDVSIIMPVHNGEAFLQECFYGIEKQTFKGTLEISVFNDRSTDKSEEMISQWLERCRERGIATVYSKNQGTVGGCGLAKNRSIAQSKGRYLCFQDADDVMYPDRIRRQVEILDHHPNTLVGTRFERKPADSMRHYTKWMNSLTDADLIKYQYREVLLIQPTWMMTRENFNQVGGYVEREKEKDAIPYPEDLDFFHRHLDNGGELHIVPEVMLMYRLHEVNTCRRTPRRSILRVKLKALERRVLDNLESFCIWGAGRDGRNFMNDLSEENRIKVVCFGDVDAKKIGTRYVNQLIGVDVPIVHFSELKPPVVCCIALGRTAGEFESNLESMKWECCKDFWYFN